MGMAEEKALCLRTFGTCSLSWNGNPLTGGTRSSETQFLHLMQLMLHFRTEGVSRVLLIDTLFADREVKNVAHSLNVLLYNARRRLEAAGLPEGPYIEQREGRFFWTARIPVEEDAAEFAELYARAGRAEGEEQLALYKEACSRYTGDFLPMQSAMLWAAQEAAKYRGMFTDCVHSACRLLRERKNYAEMEALGRYAARVQPFSDWEQVALEALIAEGRFEEARRLYNETERQYFREIKLRPSKRMRELNERISAASHPDQSMLDAIQDRLDESGWQERGARLCGYVVFEEIYRLTRRLLERYKRPATLMLCALADADGELLKKSAINDALVGRFEEALLRTLRRTDVVCRYGTYQYLALLPDTEGERIASLCRRIDAHFAESAGTAQVKYYVNHIAR